MSRENLTPARDVPDVGEVSIWSLLAGEGCVALFSGHFPWKVRFLLDNYDNWEK